MRNKEKEQSNRKRVTEIKTDGGRPQERKRESQTEQDEVREKEKLQERARAPNHRLISDYERAT